MKKCYTRFLLVLIFVSLQFSGLAQYTQITDFADGINGSTPYGSLISDGTYVYEMTRDGGTNGMGTVFKIQFSNNAHTKIFDFAGASNGRYPYGSLISDGSFLYGMTSSGGTNNMGTLFKLKISDNSYTKEIDFAGIANGSSPVYTQLLLNGNYLIGMPSSGGSANAGTVSKYQIYYSEINIKQNSTDIASGGTYDFGNVVFGSNSGAISYTIENTSDVTLTVSSINTSGTNASLFAVSGISLPATISAGGSTTFTITYTPDAVGFHSAAISIINDDADENPYPINLSGTGVKADQTITSFNSIPAKTYGDGSFTVSASSTSNLDVVFTSSDETVATCSGTNGSTITILKAGTCKIYANQAGNSNYNAAAQVEQTLTVNKKTLWLITDNLNVDKVYDGTTTATISGSAALEGLVAGDENNITLVYPNVGGTFIDKETGNDKIVTLGTFSITGTAVNNYEFVQSSDWIADIFAKELTITGIAISNKTYDGTRTATLSVTPSLFGVVSGEESMLTLNLPSTIEFSDKEAGNAKSVTLSNFSITGTGIGNYTLTQPTGPYTANIDKKTINVYADAKSKICYDPDPELTYTWSPELVSGDNFSGALTRIDGQCGNCYAQIQQGTLTLGNNYTIVYYPEDLMIGYRPITVTADANQTKVYGENDPASYTYQITSGSLFTGHTFSGALTRANGENSGTYAIQRGNLAVNNNYVITLVSSDFTITKRPITVTADAGQNKTYGDSDPVAFAYTSSEPLLAGNNFTGSLNRVAGENAGTYAISQGTLSAGTNYNISFTSTNFVINPKDLTITAENKTKIYNQANPDYSYLLSSPLVGTDVISGVSYSCSATQSSNAGTYDIVPSAAVFSSGLPGNYNMDYAKGILTIGKADQTLNFTPLPDKKTGDADFDSGATASSGLTVTFSSSNTNVASIVNGKIHIISAGTSEITASQPGNENYNAAADVTQTLTVTPSTGISELFANSIEIYPNPNSGRFTIKSEILLTGKTKISMVDNGGKTVMATYTNSGTEILVNARLGKGIYFVIIESGQNKAIKKIVIE